jgi:hypothetical protein
MQVAKPFRPRWFFGGGVALVLLIAGGWLWFTQTVQQARQAEVAARGSIVMPFDLERTTHIFTPQPQGGIQQVVADDPAATEQIALIRMHLQHEAAAFQQGDFGDPAAIHGDSMAGLAALRTSAGQIAITYRELPAGAELRFTTAEPGLIDALHAWFAAQRSDHGSHATE